MLTASNRKEPLLFTYRNMGEGLLPRKLSARFKNDFAYYTVKDRLPVTLTSIIDRLSRKQNHFREKYGEEAAESAKAMVGSFSEMKSQLQTNKAIALLDDRLPDVLAWNDRLSLPLDVENPLTDEEKKSEDYMEAKVAEPAWFNSSWLLTECYFYRRIASVFAKSKCFSQYDPFKKQKRDLLRNSLPGLKALSRFYVEKTEQPSCEEKEQIFKTLMQSSLWANRWDLSLFRSNELHSTEEVMENLEKMQTSILRDDSSRIWQLLSGDQKLSRVDIVIDNSGLEVFSDMVLADFLVKEMGVAEVHFHLKAMPWFVSDVTGKDWRWTLEWLGYQDDSALRDLSSRWTGFIEQKIWQVRGADFWTLPDAFHTMSKVDPNLYNDLMSSQLILFKGDMNYRKLTGDRKWPILKTSFKTSLMGFEPAPLCAIRTLKADILVGISEEAMERASGESKDWLVSGSYGVIQFFGKQEEDL